MWRAAKIDEAVCDARPCAPISPVSSPSEPGRVHLAAHSHHYWPDVTREAQIKAWDDAARLADGKWGHVMGPVWREAQTHVARTLSLPDPASVVFGQNTFEFWLRAVLLLSRAKAAADPRQRRRVPFLFTGLARRWRRTGSSRWSMSPAEPFADFATRFSERCGSGRA